MTATWVHQNYLRVRVCEESTAVDTPPWPLGRSRAPGASALVDDASYSPIQKLIDRNEKSACHSLCSWRCSDMSQASVVRQLVSSTSEQAAQAPLSEHCGRAHSPATVRRRYSHGDADMAELIEESAGARGDAWRFRYSEYSPEEGTHVDDDGAVCSEAIYRPLDLTIQAPSGHSLQVQVVDGMCIRHLKEKLWNITGLDPSEQRLVLANGADAADDMPFAGSGLEPGDVLLLKAK